MSTKEAIEIKGARVHNLKNVSVNIPKNKFVVITGLSGSGKSSLAFDTLYAEGQRRYVESLSSYARQFLGRLDKPEVDYIKGIAPAIAIEQKVSTSNPRSTVGTSTEIYDYLRLLFARIGKTISPYSGNEVKRHTTSDVLKYINSLEKGSKVMLAAPLIIPAGRKLDKHLEVLSQQGFTRLLHNKKPVPFTEMDDPKKDWTLLIDRFVVDEENDDNNSRILDSAQTAFYEGHGECIVVPLEGKSKSFNNRFELDGVIFEEPSDNFFSFNSPVGACKTCEGFGSVIGIDHDLVIPDQSLSLFEEAVVCWKGPKMSKWKRDFISKAEDFNFPIHKPINELTEEQYELLWEGTKGLKGIYTFFKYVESKLYKIQYRVMLSRYRGRSICPDCKGVRIRKDAGYVKVADTNIHKLLLLPVSEALEFFKELPKKLNTHDNEIGKRLLTEITNRLGYLENVGLGYLTLNRPSATLSGGESQRINLATSLGSSLVGSMYVLDEPSIGLHPRDSERLISVLKDLQALGNTVIVVEHEEEMMRAADYIIDMGPKAGSHGGEVVFTGDHKKLLKAKNSLTADYLTGKKRVPIPKKRRPVKFSLELKGARLHNLKNVDVKFPLQTLTVITGVSGSGKSTLVRQVLHPALMKKLGKSTTPTSNSYKSIEGHTNKIENIELIDQNPIGKSSRSNPVTYVKAFDDIRNLFSSQQISKINGYRPAHFSINVPGGRCDACEGLGEKQIEMQFMADVYLKCDVCKGKRFKEDILDVRFNEKNIHDVLSMTVEDAIKFFSESDSRASQNIVSKLQPLADVGLGYITLGQSSSTLSGGEAQRVKLAYFLAKGSKEAKTLFIFDEPTTGLHFHDINYLLEAMNRLVDTGHSVIIIEHNSEVIKNADWVIDIGPEGGKAGGEIVFAGVPEDLIKSKTSYTGQYLKDKLA